MQLIAPAPLVIAHRGASGHRPEHTLAAYELAIDLGADYIEPDLVITRDGALVARHEPALAQVDAAGRPIEATTNIAELPRLTSRRATKLIDGRSITGWFAEDLMLAEIKTLRARQRLPFRDQSYNDRFEVATLPEILDLVKHKQRHAHRRIGIYVETKHPAYFRSIGLPLEEPLLAALEAAGHRHATDPVFIQSFEPASLRRLRRMTKLRLVQLIENLASFREMLTAGGLAEIAAYADAIGPDKRLIVPADASGRLLPPTSLIADAHRAGLLVHPWTFRDEAVYLAAEYGARPAAEYEQFFSLGIDGLFTDFPDTALRARAAWLARRS